jgi:multicomponent Na+:H+ antiporter subunit D
MITPEYTPVLLVAIPLLGAFLTPLLGRLGASIRNGFVLLVVLINSILVFLFASDVLSEGIKIYIFGAKELTMPIVRILFEVDALSIFMAIISTILVLVGIIYSWTFVQKSIGQDKYYTLFLLVYAGMMGMVLTGDLFNFFVFLEITSISSAALIAFWTDHAESLEAAFKYIVISALGALFVLLAIALLYGQYDALNIAQLANVIQYSMMDKIALVLLIAALGMKAGLAPMHMWLPDSYGRAPATISLVLVSATLVSLYGVLRVVFTLYGEALSEIVRFDVTMNLFLGWFLIGLAVITILVGVIMALIQSDFKRLIAFSAVAELGYMFLGIGAGLAALGTAYGGTALKGGIFHIFNDALDVGLLFLVAGAVFYATKERSLDKLGGLARNMKYTTIFFIIGLLAVAGMPPLNGYASKLLIYQSTFQLNPILGIIAILCSILLLAVFVKVFYSVFMGPSLSRLGEVKEVPRSMLLGMGIIAAIIIFIGLFPEYFLSNLVEPAANALVGYQNYIATILGGV